MKFKDGAKIETEDRLYDLFDGGYIKPGKLLEDLKDIQRVNAAISTIKLFFVEAEMQNVLEEY